MATTDWQTTGTAQAPLAEPAGLPTRVRPTPAGSPPLAAPVLPVAPDWPSRWHLLVPRGVRNLAEDLGLWQNPTPLIPSDHLAQTVAVLERYGWCRSLDFSATGAMCIRGAQTLLERTGHVTPDMRERAASYIQLALTEYGVTMPYFAWNDLPERTFPQVENRLVRASHLARSNGE